MKPSQISKTDGICGGEAYLDDVGIPVWILARLRQEGASDDDLLAAYPRLSAAELEAAWMYAEGHWEEMEQAMKKHSRKIEEDLTSDFTEGTG